MIKMNRTRVCVVKLGVFTEIKPRECMIIMNEQAEEIKPLERVEDIFLSEPDLTFEDVERLFKSELEVYAIEQQAKCIARAVVNVTPNKCKRSYSEKRLQAYAQKLMLEAQKLKIKLKDGKSE